MGTRGQEWKTGSQAAHIPARQLKCKGFRFEVLGKTKPRSLEINQKVISLVQEGVLAFTYPHPHPRAILDDSCHRGQRQKASRPLTQSLTQGQLVGAFQGPQNTGSRSVQTAAKVCGGGKAISK